MAIGSFLEQPEVSVVDDLVVATFRHTEETADDVNFLVQPAFSFDLPFVYTE